MKVKKIKRKELKVEKPQTYIAQNEQVFEDGFWVTKVNKVKLEDVDVRSEFTADDYRLENLIATGTIDTLKECPKLKSDVFDSIETVESAVAGITINDIAVEQASENNDNIVNKEEEDE